MLELEGNQGHCHSYHDFSTATAGIHAKTHSNKSLIRIIIPEIHCFSFLPNGWSRIFSTSSLWWLILSWDLPNCSSPYLLVFCFISSSIYLRVVSGYLPSCNPLNPDRQVRANLYSSGPQSNMTDWKERKECMRKNSVYE